MTEPTYREAYNYEPMRYPQGHFLDQMKGYVEIPLTRDDSGMTKCATFGAFEYACKIIASIEKIPDTKVYPSLRMIGYNKRYSDMKNDIPDALWDIGEVSERCMRTSDPGIVPFVSSSTGLFTDVRSTSYRLSNSVIAITGKDAYKAGIKVSELNLFNALAGLEVLTEEEPAYFSLRENLFIDESLTKLSFIKRHLTAKRNVMLKVLGD